jgi:hypothetical protein
MLSANGRTFMPDDPETPEADAAEQQRTVTENERELAPSEPISEADEGDIAESMIEVPLDEDDYR